MSKANEFRVRVAGWSNPRTVIQRPNGTLALEIALGHNHCPTCSDRVRYVNSELSRRGVSPRWEYPYGSESFIVVDGPRAGVSVQEHLSGLLSLSIS